MFRKTNRSVLAEHLRIVSWTLALVIGGIAGACGDPVEVAAMEYACGTGPLTCRELCEKTDHECTASDPWEECPADAWGLDIAQCEDGLEGVPLDVGCDDPLPYKATDPNGFDDFACCCKRTEQIR